MKKNKKNSQPKLHLVKGDTVKVLSGNDKGKTGQVLYVLPEKNKAIVEGMRKVTKHVKPSAENTQGGFDSKEMPIHISNLQVVDPQTGEATRIGRKRNEDGRLQRYSKKTGEFI